MKRRGRGLLAQLSTILDRATRRIPADFLEPEGASLNNLYLIVHAVEDLPSGAYVFHRDRGALELLKEGHFRAEAGYLGLEQALPADASVNVFFLADLPPILQRLGNRGYRAAQLEAGITGGAAFVLSIPAAPAPRIVPERAEATRVQNPDVKSTLPMQEAR